MSSLIWGPFILRFLMRVGLLHRYFRDIGLLKINAGLLYSFDEIYRQLSLVVRSRFKGKVYNSHDRFFIK